MARHRFAELVDSPRPAFSYSQVIAEPTPATGMVVCPAALIVSAAPLNVQLLQSIYREAFERAQLALRPHWLRNDRRWEFN